MKCFCLLSMLILTLAVDLVSTDDPDTYDEYEQTTEIQPESELSDILESSDVYSGFDATTLRLVNVLYRHGDRSQIRSYTNDLYHEEDWPQGYGQLSKIGMSQEYALGEYLNERYIQTDFLTPVYQRTEIYIRSTSFDRTLMSASSVLAGMYPPIDEVEAWNEDLPWQPIPIHTVPIEDDYLLVTDSPCPVFSEALKEHMQNNPVINATMKKYADLYVYISDNSGEPNTFDGIGNVLDPIFCQNASGDHVLPDWVTPHVLDSIVELRDIYSTVRTPAKYAYLKSGPLLGEMLNHMINKSINDETTFPTKFFMYSAHDSTIVNFLVTLGVFNNKQPPYTACVMVELHEVEPDDYRVLVLYKNESDSQPYPFQLPSCDLYCPLQMFARLMESSIPKSHDAECGLLNHQENQSYFAYMLSLERSNIVALVLGSILGLVLLITCICCIKKRVTKVEHEYVPVPIEMN